MLDLTFENRDYRIDNIEKIEDLDPIVVNGKLMGVGPTFTVKHACNAKLINEIVETYNIVPTIMFGLSYEEVANNLRSLGRIVNEVGPHLEDELLDKFYTELTPNVIVNVHVLKWNDRFAKFAGIQRSIKSYVMEGGISDKHSLVLKPNSKFGLVGYEAHALANFGESYNGQVILDALIVGTPAALASIRDDCKTRIVLSFDFELDPNITGLRCHCVDISECRKTKQLFGMFDSIHTLITKKPHHIPENFEVEVVDIQQACKKCPNIPKNPNIKAIMANQVWFVADFSNNTTLTEYYGPDLIIHKKAKENAEFEYKLRFARAKAAM